MTPLVRNYQRNLAHALITQIFSFRLLMLIMSCGKGLSDCPLIILLLLVVRGLYNYKRNGTRFINQPWNKIVHATTSPRRWIGNHFHRSFNCVLIYGFRLTISVVSFLWHLTIFIFSVFFAVAIVIKAKDMSIGIDGPRIVRWFSPALIGMYLFNNNYYTKKKRMGIVVLM